MMSTSDAFIEFLRDQLGGMGAISVRRMFGGAGVFAGGVMFALVSDDTLYFKADEVTRADFAAEGLQPFNYATKDGRNTIMSYWRAPERLFDEPEEMLAWAEKALGAARRSGSKKKEGPRKRKTRAER